MRKMFGVFAAIFVGIALAPGMASAAAFEESFKLLSVSGKCMVKPANATGYARAQEGKAYPYGTSIKTGKNSSLTVQFSAENECRVSERAQLDVLENRTDKKQKIVALNSGRVNVTLEEGFHARNGLSVRTPVVTCQAIGCKFSVSSQLETDLRMSNLLCTEGRIGASDTDFSVNGMQAGAGLSVATARDRLFTRLKNIGGEYKVTVRDEMGKPRDIDMKLGSIIKIYRKVSDDGKTLTVTITICAADGSVIERFSHTIPNYLQQPDWPKMRPTLFPFPISTTTTVPSPTPVGRR